MALHVKVLLTLATAIVAAAPAFAQASGSPTLSAQPTQAVAVTAGKHRLGNGAIAYVPDSTGPRPLLVLVHGAGDRAATFVDRFTGFADREGVILLSVQSRGPTWDLAPKQNVLGGPLAMKSKPVLRFGPDVARVDQALGELFRRAAVNPRRIALLGFSDGASYALSLGLANPQLFRSVVALSPGFVVTPALVAPSQRIFIAHGRQDRVLPFRVAEKDIAGLITANGLKPRFRPFDGDHYIDEAALAEGLAYAFGL